MITHGFYGPGTFHQDTAKRTLARLQAMVDPTVEGFPAKDIVFRISLGYENKRRKYRIEWWIKSSDPHSY